MAPSRSHAATMSTQLSADPVAGSRPCRTNVRWRTRRAPAIGRVVEHPDPDGVRADGAPVFAKSLEVSSMPDGKDQALQLAPPLESALADHRSSGLVGHAMAEPVTTGPATVVRAERCVSWDSASSVRFRRPDVAARESRSNRRRRRGVQKLAPARHRRRQDTCGVHGGNSTALTPARPARTAPSRLLEAHFPG